MSRATKWLAAALALLCAASAAFLLLRPKGTAAPVATVTLDGEVVETIDLDGVEEGYSFTLTAPDGGSNTVEVAPGKIRVSHADCPDQVCVKQGFIEDGTVPIVCLPHKLIIEIRGGGDGLDAATG